MTVTIEDADHDGVTLVSLLGDIAATEPDSICSVCHYESSGGSCSVSSTSDVLTYGEAWLAVLDFQAWLQEKTKDLNEQDDVVVSILSSNSIDMLLMIIACSSVPSAPVALLNVRWSAKEMAQALTSKNHNSGTLLCYGPGFESISSAIIKSSNHRTVAWPIPSLASDRMHRLSIPSQPNGSSSIRNVDASVAIFQLQRSGSTKDAVVVFTSGTTGGAKGVRLSHKALAIQSFAKLQEPCLYSRDTAMITSTVPLFHVGGLSSCLAVLWSRGKLLFPSSTAEIPPGFQPSSVLASVQHSYLPVNTLVVVPAMLISLLEFLRQQRRSATFPCVKLILVGSQSLSEGTLQKVNDTFPAAKIVQTYACTEAASSLTFLEVNRVKSPPPPENIHVSDQAGWLFAGTNVGKPPAHVDLRLYRKDGRVTKIVTLPHHLGVIATRGDHLLNGYWVRGFRPRYENPGWYMTGDIGYWDTQGNLFFCGRVKDTVRTGGETVMAQEVESVMLSHPDIVECVVFPRTDERFGEAVAAAIVMSRSGTSPLSLAVLRDFCQRHGLASYKRPRYVFHVDSLPRNSSGKVLKVELKRLYGNQKLQSKL